jgi:hypothetical protein
MSDKYYVRIYHYICDACNFVGEEIRRCECSRMPQMQNAKTKEEIAEQVAKTKPDGCPYNCIGVNWRLAAVYAPFKQVDGVTIKKTNNGYEYEVKP